MTTDYFLLLESANKHLSDIIILEKNLPNNKHLHLEISKSIRYFSSDIESALDYITYDLFMMFTYPKMIENKKSENSIKQAKRNVHFPSYKKEQNFNKFMKDAFSGLQTEYPDIFALLKLNQSFNFDPQEEHWLQKLNHIVNVSKHRHLTKNTKFQNGIIRKFQYQGITLKNVRFEKVGSLMNIGGVELTPEIAKYLDLDFDGEITTICTFTDKNEPVVELLDRIHSQTSELISSLHNLIITIE